MRNFNIIVKDTRMGFFIFSFELLQSILQKSSQNENIYPNLRDHSKSSDEFGIFLDNYWASTGLLMKKIVVCENSYPQN